MDIKRALESIKNIEPPDCIMYAAKSTYTVYFRSIPSIHINTYMHTYTIYIHIHICACTYWHAHTHTTELIKQGQFSLVPAKETSTPWQPYIRMHALKTTWSLSSTCKRDIKIFASRQHVDNPRITPMLHITHTKLILLIPCTFLISLERDDKFLTIRIFLPKRHAHAQYCMRCCASVCQ